MVGKCRKCTNFKRVCKHFPPINHFYILSPINLWDNRVLSCIMVLNQDLQDFEDFLVLGVGLGWCVPQHKINENIRFSFRRCDHRIGEIYSQGHISNFQYIKPATSSVILKILKILIQNPCEIIHLQINFTSNPATSSLILKVLKILIQNPCDSIHLRINFTSKPATSSVILKIL